MITTDELKQMNQFAHLKPDMLEKIAKVVVVETHRAGKCIYREGEYAKKFYSILEGNVSLDIEKDSSTKISIEHLSRGRSLGLASLLEEEQRYRISDARTLEDTRVLTWKATDFEKLFHEDSELGYLFMKRMASVIKKRLIIKNAQLASYY